MPMFLRLLDKLVGVLLPFLWLGITVMSWICFFGFSWELFHGHWIDFVIMLGFWMATIEAKGWIVDWRPSFSRQLFLMIRYGAAEGMKRSTHYDR
jgi:hypothetical protein